MSSAVYSPVRAEPGNESAPRILVVDDSEDIREPMAEFLASRGYAVGTAPDGIGLHHCLARDRYDLVLLDVMLPGEDGLSLCRKLHARHGPPVILLTAMGEPADRVRGLDTGADDYVVKPFDPSELLARIRTVLRRVSRHSVVTPTAAKPNRVRIDAWTFDPLQAELRHDDGRSVSLSSGEARLLQAFIAHPREVLSRERLLELCAAPDTDVFERSIDSHMSRLRRKVEDNSQQPRLLKTVWAKGYMLTADVSPAP